MQSVECALLRELLIKIRETEQKAMKKVGLLAGVGNLPVEYARAMKDAGRIVVTVALVPGVEEELQQVSSIYEVIPVGKIGKILSFLKKNEVTELVMLGKVSKEFIMEGSIIPDFKGLALLARVKDYKDDTLLQACLPRLWKGQRFVRPFAQSKSPDFHLSQDQ